MNSPTTVHKPTPLTVLYLSNYRGLLLLAEKDLCKLNDYWPETLTILLFEDAKKALACIKEESVDRVMVSFGMPEGRGVWFCEQCKKLAPDLPILLTAMCGESFARPSPPWDTAFTLDGPTSWFEITSNRLECLQFLYPNDHHEIRQGIREIEEEWIWRKENPPCPEPETRILWQSRCLPMTQGQRIRTHRFTEKESKVFRDILFGEASPLMLALNNDEGLIDVWDLRRMEKIYHEMSYFEVQQAGISKDGRYLALRKHSVIGSICHFLVQEGGGYILSDMNANLPTLELRELSSGTIIEERPEQGQEELQPPGGEPVPLLPLSTFAPFDSAETNKDAIQNNTFALLFSELNHGMYIQDNFNDQIYPLSIPPLTEVVAHPREPLWLGRDALGDTCFLVQVMPWQNSLAKIKRGKEPIIVRPA